MRKSLKILQVAALVYSVRRWNRVPISHGKLLYIFFLSPVLLVRSMWTHDEISYTYRRFLMSFTYPECKLGRQEVYRSCKNLHVSDENCYTSFTHQFWKAVRKAWRMYLRIYMLQACILMFLRRKSLTRRRACLVIQNGIKNAVRSTAFFSGQTGCIRMLLCLAESHKVVMTKRTLYLLSVIGSIPIMFERGFRVRQINSMVASHLLYGALEKLSAKEKDGNIIFSLYAPVVACVGTCIWEQRVILSTAMVSIITAATF